MVLEELQSHYTSIKENKLHGRYIHNDHISPLASKFSKFANFGKSPKGHLCLQDHGNVVSFRNIKVREIKK